MTNRSDLVQAIHAARGDGRALAQTVAALDAHDAAARNRAAADREVDLGAAIVGERLYATAAHELHTAATDWIADFELPPDDGYRTAMVAEASTWYGHLDPAVRENTGELAEQARGRAATLASAYPLQATAAQQEFLRMVGYLHQTQAASGLPQIDQTVDPNNSPSATPYPTDVFPTFGEEQDQFNGVETDNHQSQADSARAPMLQQVNQQNSSGSGFGSGPERPDMHDTRFDTADSYAEVPLGPAGTIPTAPAGTDRQVGSAPNPGAGQPQDAGADKRPTVTAMAGYSAPDPSGYRWAMQAEVMHPFHEKCASAHWPDEACGDRSHTASMAIGYTTNLEDAHRVAAAERVGVAEGLRSIAAAATVADLGTRHNQVAQAWAAADHGEDDTAVLRGFMAVVRPVLAERAAGGEVTGYLGEMAREFAPVLARQHTAGDSGARCDNCAEGDHKRCTAAGCSCTHTSKPSNWSEASRLDFKQGAAGPGQCHICGDEADGTCTTCDKPVCDDDATSKDGDRFCHTCSPRAKMTNPWQLMPTERTAASSLDQIQQTVDPNNQDTPQDDKLPEGVAFPISDSFAQQWVTGPGGAQPKGGQKEAATMNGLPTGAASLFGHMDALDGKLPQHKDNYPFSSKAHGAYLRSWNGTHAAQTAISGGSPLTREGYGNMTGRPDLYPHWKDSYDQASRVRASQGGVPTTAARNEHGDHREGDDNRCTSCGHLPGCDCTHDCDNDQSELDHSSQRYSSRQVTADTLSQPHQTTDDADPPFNSPATAPQPQSANASPQDSDSAAGAAAGRSDRAAGQRPAFADNSSGVSPYVKAYAEAYGASEPPQGAQDVPVGIGGDNGQGMNTGEAQKAFQVAQASRRRVSAAFAPGQLFDNPGFSKGYLFASKWKPGDRLVSQGSAEFEAGLYAGVTDRPQIQQRWLARHASMAGRHPELATRIQLHAAFTARKTGHTGAAYITAADQRTAGVSTDLITDGPGTSPDPMGATPINGPGTPPPMGGRDEAATPGGAPPYQGAPPLPGGPVVPDDVVGKPQQPAQPGGPFTNTFSGDHPENANLAPVAPDSAAKPGYSNPTAYQGSPGGGDRVARLAAFRTRVQAGLAAMTEEAAR